MSITEPPIDYRWHHVECKIGGGNDVVKSMTAVTLQNHREMRLAWLDQFELEITEKGAFRWWMWYDGERSVRWAESRPLSDPLPKVPGFWPSDA